MIRSKIGGGRENILKLILIVETILTFELKSSI